MAALDALSSNILPGESGGIPTTSPADSSPSGLGSFFPVPGPKGAKGVLSSSNSEAVLANMQKFINDRQETPFSKFTNALQDASLAGNPQAQTDRRRLQDERSKNTLDMQLQLAQFKASQDLQAQRAKSWDQFNKSNTGSGTDSGGMSTTGIPPEALKYAAFLRSQGPEGEADAIKYLSKVSEDISKSNVDFQNSAPALKQELYTYKTLDGKVHQGDFNAQQWQKIQRSGKLPNGTPIMADSGISSQPATTAPQQPALTAPRQLAPTAPIQTTPGISPKDIAKVESGNSPYAVGPNVPGQGSAKSEMQVMDKTSLNPGFGVQPAQLTGDKAHDEAERVRVGTDYHAALVKHYGDDSLGTAAYNWGPGNVDKWIAEGANINKMPADVRDYVAKAHLAHVASTQQPSPVETAPVQTTGRNAARVEAEWASKGGEQNSADFAKHKSQLEAAQKADIDEAVATHAASLKGKESLGTKTGEAAAKMLGLADQAKEVIASADNVTDHATRHPDEFGYKQQKGIAAPILSGLSISPTLENAAESVMSAMNPKTDKLGLTQSQRRATTNSDAQKLGLHYAAEMFAGSGARLGLGLEQMAAKAKGVGTEFPASTNIMNAKLIKLAAQKAKDLAPLWDKYSKADPSGEANYYSFLQTPQALAVEAKWDPSFKNWVDSAKQQDPSYYNSLLNKNKPDLNSFFKKKNHG